MANKDFKGFKKDEDTYNCYDSTARSGVNGLTPRVGIAEGKIATLEEQMLSVEDDLDNLGTASTKNSTSVVTDSTDLVESGAVKDIVGWGNKNLTDWKWNTFTADSKLLITLNKGTYTISAQSTIPNGTTFIRGTKQDSSYCSKAELGVANWNDSATTGVYATTELLSSYTFSVPEDNVLIEFGRTNCNGTIPAQLEKGSIATTYEPYHVSVDESKADNSVIGTVEEATASKAWSVGEHFINGGQFKEVTQPIASGGAISDSNTTNKPIADCLVKQATFSGTTDASGLVEIYNGNRIVLHCESSTGNRIIIPFYSNTRSKVMARCFYEDGSVIASGSVSGTYYYI